MQQAQKLFAQALQQQFLTIPLQLQARPKLPAPG